MKNGLMTIEKTDEETKAVFIDQDVLECAKLNMRTKKRIGKYEKERVAKERKRKRMERSVNRILAEALVGLAVAFCGSVGMIHPILWCPISILCLCVASLHLGAMLGKVGKR